MTEKELIINLEKSITGERRRSISLSSKEAIWSIRYIMLNVFKFKPTMVEYFLDTSFMMEYGLYRYYRMIDCPSKNPADRYSYVLHEMFPDIYTEQVKVMAVDKYIRTLSPTSKATDNFWETYHDYRGMCEVIRWVCQTLFPGGDLLTIMEFVSKNPDAFIKTITILKLRPFFEELYIFPLDMIYFCFPKEDQLKYFKEYSLYRLPLCDDDDFEMLTQAAECLKERNLL